MARLLRLLLPVALAFAATPAGAAPAPVATLVPVIDDSDVMAHVRADRGAAAAAAAARYADPVAARLVTYFRLLAPGAAGTAEIAAFIQASPDWPLQASLGRRRDEALASEPDDALVARECAREPPRPAAALLHCATTFARIGRPTEVATMTRRAWVAGVTEAGGTEPAWEQAFLLERGAVLTPSDHSARFARLLAADAPRQPAALRQQQEALQRQIARLSKAEIPLAEARLAVRRDDPQAPRLLAALGDKARQDPELFLDQAQALRRAGRDEAALAWWSTSGTPAEKAAVAERRPVFWAERQQLARRRLRDGDAAGAYALVAGHAQSAAEPAVDAEFLAGFIALRRMNDPPRALGHFRRLAALSKAAITQGRAQYWIGRAEAAAGHADAASAAYAEGARWPNTFYGQLAALTLGEAALALRIVAAGDPPADPARAMEVARRELARAATLLVQWGEARRAQSFLLRLDEVAPDPADRVLVANLATKLALPETAVALARKAGRDGVLLMDSGWPQPVVPPPGPVPEVALVLGVIRQESSFDSTTISPVGARGLMQIMPATGAQTARKLGLPASVPALVLDPAYNMRIGAAYLRDLSDQFGGAVPLIVAGYNAGPGRVAEWLRANGDPRLGEADMIDWIELIPFAETRNYVQRVIENQVIYRARRGETRPHPLTPWLR